jgi:hypothetical protein
MAIFNSYFYITRGYFFKRKKRRSTVAATDQKRAVSA